MNIDDLKSQLERFRIKPDRKLGQNFLLSEDVLDKIIAASELGDADRVLEIGPGLGALTMRLADKAREVMAVEKDRRLALVLRQIFRKRKNITVIQDDALFFDPSAYNLEPRTYKLIANLPYYITGSLLQKFLTIETKPSLMVVLLQKEVAERVVAKPGDLSILGVASQLYADAEIVGYVGKENFYPVPAVDSAIVRFRLLPKTRFDVEEKPFFQIVKMGFSSKRKQLHNNLKDLFAPADAKEVLRSVGVSPLARAEDLSLESWYRLYQRLNNGRT